MIMMVVVLVMMEMIVMVEARQESLLFTSKNHCADSFRT